jgi:hypothetical protein
VPLARCRVEVDAPTASAVPDCGCLQRQRKLYSSAGVVVFIQVIQSVIHTVLSEPGSEPGKGLAHAKFCDPGHLPKDSG